LILAHLFVKAPEPKDSEGTFSVFESTCHLLLYRLTTQRLRHSVKSLAQGHKKATCRIFRHSLIWMSAGKL